MTALNVLSLFSGIGGLDLGLERAGMTVVGQVEIDPYCQRVLAKHWPHVPQHDDVRTAADWWLSQERPAVDVICGGFPCQPFSDSGLRLGLADERWGWPWFEHVVRMVRPRHIIVENVPGLLRVDHGQAFGIILADLAALGFTAEWGVLSACTLGAPHARERLFLLAHSAVDDVAGPLPPPAESTAINRDEPRGSHRRAWRDWWLREPAMGRVAHGLPPLDGLRRTPRPRKRRSPPGRRVHRRAAPRAPPGACRMTAQTDDALHTLLDGITTCATACPEPAEWIVWLHHAHAVRHFRACVGCAAFYELRAERL